MRNHTKNSNMGGAEDKSDRIQNASAWVEIISAVVGIVGSVVTVLGQISDQRK